MPLTLARTALILLFALVLSPVLYTDAEAACNLEPLTLPLFNGTPVAELAASATPVAVPDVDATTMRDALEQYVACTNTGEPTLVWAVFSPRWFAETFADPTVHYLPAFEQMLDAPAWAGEEPLHLEQIEGITMQPDGRVEVTATFRSGEEHWTDRLTLVMIGNTWLIDEVHNGTPAP